MSDDASERNEQLPEKGIWLSLGLTESLSAAVQQYRNDHERYYAKLIGIASDEVSTRLAQVELVAAAIFGDAQKLGASDLDPIVEHLSKLRDHAGEGDDLAVNEAVFEALNIMIGEHLVTVSMAANERLFHLLLLMKKCQASHRAARFLSCVSRCYLFGMDVECIAMCRAALDAQIKAEILDDDCVTALGERPRGKKPQFDLVDRIAAALKLGRISQDLSAKAHLVRQNGNDVLHTAPSLPRPAIAVIHDTLTVIEALA